MAERWRDADLLEALPFAKGDDRAILFNALAFSVGIEGPAQLRLLYASETGPARSNALHALARRCGGAATDVLSEGLRSRSVEVQGKAASELAQVGTADAAEAVFEWLDRKLGRKGREENWDPCELPSAIRFAVRHGLHSEVARIVAKHWTALNRDERSWLGRTWPALLDGTGAPVVAADVAPPLRVHEDVYQDQRGRRAFWRDDPKAWAKHNDECIRRALKNAEGNRRRSESDD